jgi:phospholipase/carboxylesterase
MNAVNLEFLHRYIPGQASDGITLLLLHGTGGNEESLLELGRLLAPRAGLLSPRGKTLENGMPRFFRRLAEGVFDREDLIRRTHELADFIWTAAETYRFDSAKVCAVGFSNGANIAASLLLLRPESLAGAVLLRPMVPLEPERLPDLAGRPVYIGAGRRDPMVPAQETERLARLLQSAGAEVALHWRDAGHGLIRQDVESARQWLETHALSAPQDVSRSWS